ncbi:MAG: alanyl-tRNA synthetase [Candidatus Moranbacteria bacterium GW2011_GWC2_37_8]|nr:MAG: alanyl-tRNA synthetase [Candidatus Moranbacteria bacterium GW2011_GWC2_37_8]KKQ62728.1 MAG: alanyl-tRNA synthetase, alanyl-tRNA synthetase [Parcubacteria group bacterium GW2011_GWC1_38_22]KKQ80177.1 MAG: alanyl-tRNA synthetase [Candidatus Moranbacteria bacterium GW2011_GWD2_38_7]
MNANELRTKYLKFFESKGHTIVPSALLTPENDPTTLFTGSGMQPMIQYLLGEKHPLGTRLVDSQKCFRAQDIEEVGDNRHTTFFEMLGNWSFGDYFKKEQVAWMFEFLTKEIGLDPEKLFVTVFRGNDKLGIARDTEAVSFWKEKFAEVGIEAKDVDFSERDGMQGGKIFYYEEKKNWWSRAGVPDNMPLGELGGPDSEMFWDFGVELGLHEKSEFKDLPCHVNCDCGRFLEIGNNVFMQYIKTEKGFEQLPKGNIDFGGGLERMVAVSENTQDIFLTDLFSAIILKIEELSGKKYAESEDVTKSFRIICDHLKAGTFLIGDGVVPLNTGAGYVLRRLIRRAVRYGKLIGIEKDFSVNVAEIVIQMYSEQYPELNKKRATIFDELKKEEEKFRKTIENGLRQFNKMSGENISGKDAFDLYQTYGFPLELTIELANEKNVTVDEVEFNEELKKHQELSRTASAGMFKGGLQDSGEETTKLHTAAHLMLSALRKVLGDHVMQKGSNITAERLRFDFSHGEKMTDEQKKEVERLVNDAIEANAVVKKEEMTLDEAKKAGAMGAFESKYGEKVTVYTAEKDGVLFSKEICGGPHVEHTGALGSFRIQKEEASSAGVRRIKAVLE